MLLFFKRTAIAFSIIAVTIFSCSEKKSSSNTNTTSVDSSGNTITNEKEFKPSGPKPTWGENITAPMQVVMEKLASYNNPPLHTLTPQEVRTKPSPATAANDVIKEYSIQVPPMNVDTVARLIPIAGGQIPVRIYTPKTGKDSYPVIVYYHGGGWVIADLNTYNASAESLSSMVDAIVVSVAYRQGPEFKFPTAHNDSYAAYEWVIKNAASIKGDSSRVAVVGESAGGNLAAAVSMMARDKGFKMPLHQVLIYPIANYDTTSASYEKYAMAKPLDRPLMSWFFKHYLRSSTDGKNPMISLVNANLKGLPSTTIIGAEIDPLQSEGKLLDDKLKAAGVSTTYQLYNGVTHEFFGMAAILPEAKQAQNVVSKALKQAFSK
ncbi:MAG: alpha/beta hydrolase [Ferruginibacter sp.]